MDKGIPFAIKGGTAWFSTIKFLTEEEGQRRVRPVYLHKHGKAAGPKAVLECLEAGQLAQSTRAVTTRADLQGIKPATPKLQP